MRFILEFETKKKSMPIEYRKVFMHFLKTCIGAANEGKYYDTFYEKGKDKNFTYAVFFDEPVFKSESIELASNRVKMIFSVLDTMSGYIFYSSFLEKKHTIIPLQDNNSMMLNRVTKIAEPEVHTNKMLIKMNSPLLARKHNRENNSDQYYYFEEREFSEEIMNNIRCQLVRNGFSDASADTVKIQPIKCRKLVVQHYGCKFAGSIGNFLVEGDSLVLTYLLRAGIGSRHSEGFGMAELLTDEV